VARVVAFIPDLLFGSSVLSALQGAGHQVELRGELDGPVDADLLIVDLTTDHEQRIERAARYATPKLAFYSHVETDVRTRAQAAGFDLVVPRSRMARDAVTLAERLLAGAGQKP
jgi:hypothetical protein